MNNSELTYHHEIFPFKYAVLIEGIPSINKQMLKAKYCNVVFTEAFGHIEKGTKFNYLDVSVNKPYLVGYDGADIIRIPYKVTPLIPCIIHEDED